jgi:hypothetical protein
MIGALQTIQLPKSPEFTRDYIVPEQLRSPEIEGQYDFHTLIYDAFYISRKRSICLICPKLLNFEMLLRQGTFTADRETLHSALQTIFASLAELRAQAGGASVPERSVRDQSLNPGRAIGIISRAELRCYRVERQ